MRSVAIIILVCSSFLVFAEDYDPFRPASYESRAVVRSAFESFAQRHPVLKVYPSHWEWDTTITFDIQGFSCIAAHKYGRSDVGEVTCYVAGQLNGYAYHENQNGQLVRGRYVKAFSNHPPAATKECVHFDKYITYYAECGSRRGRQ
jgi:hypothetical protein